MVVLSALSEHDPIAKERRTEFEYGRLAPACCACCISSAARTENLTKENRTESGWTKRESLTPNVANAAACLSATITTNRFTAKGVGCSCSAACVATLACRAAGLPARFFTEGFAAASGRAAAFAKACDSCGPTNVRTSSRPHSTWIRHSTFQERQESEASQDAKDDQEWQANQARAAEAGREAEARGGAGCKRTRDRATASVEGKGQAW